jgi:hypothetical protein
LQSPGRFFWKRGVSETGNIVFLISPTIPFLKFLKKGRKSRFFQKHPHEYRSTATQECIHAVSFHFHVTVSLEFDILKIGAKLGTLPELAFFACLWSCNIS